MGSVKATVMSSFWERTNWTFTIWLTESLKKPLEIIVAQAAAMPIIERRVRIGLRSMFRAMIRDGWESQRPMPSLFDQRHPVLRRGFGPHRLGGGLLGRPPEGVQGADQGRGDR